MGSVKERFPQEATSKEICWSRLVDGKEPVCPFAGTFVMTVGALVNWAIYTHHSCTTGNRLRNLCYDSWSLSHLGYSYPGTTPVMIKLDHNRSCPWVYIAQVTKAPTIRVCPHQHSVCMKILTSGVLQTPSLLLSAAPRAMEQRAMV